MRAGRSPQLPSPENLTSWVKELGPRMLMGPAPASVRSHSCLSTRTQFSVLFAWEGSRQTLERSRGSPLPHQPCAKAGAVGEVGVRKRYSQFPAWGG